MAAIRTDLSTGRRIYVQTAYGEPAVGKLKSLGAKWDPECKCWWLGAAKRAALEELLVSADQAEDIAKDQGLPPEKEDPHQVRLAGKATYKGRTYYVRWVGETKRGHSARLVTLDQSLDFWAACARPGQPAGPEECQIVKIYQPREEWDGRRYSGQTRKVYTTLGSICDFIAKEDRNRKAGGEVCGECGKSGQLVRDLEDGILKHRHCCDIEP